jgi:hypothetical protein
MKLRRKILELIIVHLLLFSHLVPSTGPVPGSISPRLHTGLHGRDVQIPEDIWSTLGRAELHYVLHVYRVLCKILQKENLIDSKLQGI